MNELNVLGTSTGRRPTKSMPGGIWPTGSTPTTEH